jgi:hypothetical protein
MYTNSAGGEKVDVYTNKLYATCLCEEWKNILFRKKANSK